MAQDLIVKFLNSNKPQKYTAREIYVNIYPNKEIHFVNLQNNLAKLCKHKLVSYDGCIIRTKKGENTYDVPGKIYWIDNTGLSITPIVHVEDIPFRESDFKVSDLFIKKVK